jgi:hypothetical protein
MNRMKQIFLLLVIVFALNSCSGTIKGTINQHEWLQTDVRKGDKPTDPCIICGENWIFIPNEPFAAQRQAHRDQGFTWANKVVPVY